MSKYIQEFTSLNVAGKLFFLFMLVPYAIAAGVLLYTIPDGIRIIGDSFGDSSVGIFGGLFGLAIVAFCLGGIVAMTLALRLLARFAAKSGDTLAGVLGMLVIVAVTILGGALLFSSTIGDAK